MCYCEQGNEYKPCHKFERKLSVLSLSVQNNGLKSGNEPHTYN